MIRIERNKVEEPYHLKSDSVVRKKAELSAYMALDPAIRRQRRPPTEDVADLLLPVKNDLGTLFAGKCAYCETPIDHEGMIDHFRPISGASSLGGGGSIEHYVWLSFSWDNLYYCCPACNRAKRQLFPVSGIRIDPNESVDHESSLLIDPCRDNPQQFLNFLKDGTVSGLGERGKVTIDVLNLNRSELIRRRRTVARDVSSLLQKLEFPLEQFQRQQGGVFGDVLITQLMPLLRRIGDYAPFAAVGRQILQRQFDEVVVRDLVAEAARIPEERAPEERFWVSDVAPLVNPNISSTHRRVSVEEDDAVEEYTLSSRPLRGVEICNFKLIANLNLQIAPPEGKAPWLMLLGENATGKTSVLQAIALCLLGATQANRVTNPSAVLRRGEREGFVRLWFWDHDEPVEIKFDSLKGQFSGTKKASTFVLGYGTTRIPGHRSRMTNFRFGDVRGLFNGSAQIPTVNSWLVGLDEEQFDAVARALRTLLPIEQDAMMVRRGRKVFFRIGDTLTPVRMLSAGYQAMVALAVHAMRVFSERWSFFEAAQGVVIIDEIESHLHPTWKMRVVDSLRRTFPSVQFLASTHDPLVLRGMRKGEIVLMRHDPSLGSIAINDLPDPASMRVDQLLTSEHFGLNSTMDPKIEAAFSEYYHLLSLDGRTAAQDARMEELRAGFDGLHLMGNTRRERLMFEAIDRHIVLKARAISSDERKRLTADLRRTLDTLWTSPSVSDFE